MAMLCNPIDMVHRWRLSEVMARYRISGVDLAQELGVTRQAVSNMKNRAQMPRMDGQQLDQLCEALSKLSGKQITVADLLEWEEIDSE